MITKMPVYRHNRCLYNGMHDAVHTLQELQGAVPEARTNLVRIYVEQKQYGQAYEMMKQLEPIVSTEYTLKAAAYAFYGQHADDMEALVYARDAYAMVGQSDADKDSLLGRCSMAVVHLLNGDFD